MPKLLRHEPTGVGQYFDGYLEAGKLVREVCSSTCSHCGALTEFESRRKMFEHVDVCRGCMKLICLKCVGRPCRTQEAEAEQIERAVRKQIFIAEWV